MDIGDYPGGNIGDVYVFTNADSVKVYKNDEFVKEFFPGNRFADLPHPPVIVDDLIGELISKHESYSEKLCASIKECLLATAKYGMDNLPLKYKLKLAKMMLVDKLTLNDATRLYGDYVAGWGGASIVYRFDGIKNGKVFKSVTRRPAEGLKLSYDVSSSELIEGKTYDAAAVRMAVTDDSGNTAIYSKEIIELSCEGCIEIIGPQLLSFQGGSGGTYVRTIGKTGKGVLHIGNKRLGYKDIEFNVKKEKQ